MNTIDSLDQLHVVSDLHLGGEPGHQIFNQGPALAALIRHLCGPAAPARRARKAARDDAGHVAAFRGPPATERASVGLVLNGDIVDFLASEEAKYLDPERAVDKLDAIFEDQAFLPVWDALARFARAEGRVLVLVLGNHDVELALPAVTERLLERLCGQDQAARGRVRVALDGAGYTCLIGGRKVLCVHGNQVDPWNPVDFDALRHMVEALQAGEAPPAWEPNAGTRLVIDVMNAIKRDFAFVDLLKPESVPVPAVLLALPSQHHASVFDFAKIMVRRLYDQGRLTAGFLSGRPAGEIDGPRALEILTRPGLWEAPEGWGEPRTGVDWLQQATVDYEAGRRPVDLAGGEAGETLGWAGILWDRLRGRDPRDNLREALATYLAGDRTFRFDTEDDTFRRIDRAAGDADFVVAGHTHLARRLERKRGPGVYFNSGTWIRLIQLSQAMLTVDGFAPVYDALRAGTLEALDRIRDLVLQRRTVVSIWADDDGVHGELRSALPAEPGAAPGRGGPPWVAERSTRYTCPRLDRPASETPS